MISPCQKATRGRKAGHELAAVNAHRFPRAKGEQPARGNRYDEHAFAKLFEDRLEGGRASPRAAQVRTSAIRGPKCGDIRKLLGWGTWIRTKIDGVRVPAASSCLPRLKPGTAPLREYQDERPTVTVVPTGYLWPETAYASPLQFSPPILKHISAIKTKLGTEP